MRRPGEYVAPEVLHAAIYRIFRFRSMPWGTERSNCSGNNRIRVFGGGLHGILVPTLCVGTHIAALCAASRLGRGASQIRRSHGDRGSEIAMVSGPCFSFPRSAWERILRRSAPHPGWDAGRPQYKAPKIGREQARTPPPFL